MVANSCKVRPRLKGDTVLSYLALGSFVGRIQLNNLLEVIPCLIKLLHTKQCLSPSEQSLLIGCIQLQGLH